jgi:hypothetical protein
MYIRKVTKKTGNYQRDVYRLVESYRTESGPRQRTILTLKDFDLPEKDWKYLADTIEAKLRGQLIAHLDKDIDFLSEHYVSLIQEKRLSQQQNVQIIKEEEAPDYESVNINSVKNKNVRTLGAEYIGMSAYNDLGLDELFTDLGFNRHQRHLAALSIVGRLAHSGSEKATREWAQQISGIESLLNTSFANLSNNALYRIADKIYEHKDVIENHLQKRERALFNLEEKLILYDLTNTYFEGRLLGNDKAKHGWSKESRRDCKLLTLGLIIDEAGFPKRTRVMKGNQSEPESLLEMIALLENKTVEELKADQGHKKNKTVVIDAGISTKSNLEMLTKYGYDYICVARTKPISMQEIDTGNLKKIRETKKNTIEVQLFENEQENILYCRSYLRGEKEQKMLENYKQKMESDLLSIKDGLKKKGGTKKYDKVLERLGRIKERNSSISRYYLINVHKDQDTNKATEITWEFNDIDKLESDFSGSYFLKTSCKYLNEEELWSIYSMLNVAEAAFRCLKTDLAFRPVYHQKTGRGDSHLFIAVLAYHLLNTIRTKLSDKDIHISWKKLRKLMSTQTSVTTTMKAKMGKHILIKQASEAEYFHQEIYKALGINPCPLKRIITKY